MSEYQYVAFRAIDGPVSESNLRYMEKQSSRAEITAWSFNNEYHYGDFRGNAFEMLQRGYDLHLHYANFGIRTLLIRLPFGLPSPNDAKPYLKSKALRFVKDKLGNGGILAIEPSYESDGVDELFEVDAIVERLVPLRSEIMAGDLRPLYLARLAVLQDMNHDPDEAVEPPVPAGLGNLSSGQVALAELYGLSDTLIAAASQASPAQDNAMAGNQELAWLATQSAATKDAWLAGWLADMNSPLRREMLAQFHEAVTTPCWKSVPGVRTISALKQIADEISRKSEVKAAARADREKTKRMAKMAVDPTATLREVEQLVKERGTQAYCQAAQLLAELREALVGSDKAGLAEAQAKQLRDKHPTLRTLISELRKHGFLPKFS